MKTVLVLVLILACVPTKASSEQTEEYAVKCAAFAMVATAVPPKLLMEIIGAESQEQIAPFYQTNLMLGQMFGMLYSETISDSPLTTGEIISARDAEIQRLAKVFQIDPTLILDDVLICDSWGTKIWDYLLANIQKLDGTEAELNEVIAGLPALDISLTFSEEEKELGFIVSFAAFSSFLDQGGVTPSDLKTKLKEMLAKD